MHGKMPANRGLRISGHKADGILTDFTEEHTSLGTTSTSAILKSHTASRKHPRKQRSIAWSDSTQKILISAVRTPKNLRICLRKRLRDRSDVPAETRGDWPTDELCFPAPSVIKPEEKRIRCRLRTIDAHAEQEGSEFSRIGNRKGL